MHILFVDPKSKEESKVVMEMVLGEKDFPPIVGDIVVMPNGMPYQIVQRAFIVMPKQQQSKILDLSKNNGIQMETAFECIIVPVTIQQPEDAPAETTEEVAKEVVEEPKQEANLKQIKAPAFEGKQNNKKEDNKFHSKHVNHSPSAESARAVFGTDRTSLDNKK